MSNNEVIVELKNISKAFGKKVANDNVSLDLRKGEILSLLGENGSGKTSLMNILSGIYFPDEGEVFINGEKVTITSPHDAFKYHIGMVHQHFKLVDVFTATQNVVLGLDKNNGQKGFNLKESANKINEICHKYGFVVDPNKKVYDMSVSEKQTLEIVKTLYRGVDILILDEPTAVLTPQEINKLFVVLKKMKEDGKSIIIITHKLNEVMEISDRVSVLRKAQYVGTVNTSDTSIEELTEMMVGKKTTLNIDRSEPLKLGKLLEVKNLNVTDINGRSVVKNVSFDLSGGEILGIAGISGSGQKELLEAIAGVQKIASGDIIYHRQKKDKPVSFYHKSLKQIKNLANEGCFHNPDGTPTVFTKETSNREIRHLVNSGSILFNDNETMFLKGKNPREIRELGIHLAFVPEDRLGMGLVGSMNISDNMMLRSYRKGKSVFLDFKRPEKVAERIIQELEVSTPGTKMQVKKLSGGNVQKVLVGREIAYAPNVFMVAYPVRGLDINSSYTIYNLLDKQKRNGVGIIYVGEDLDVLLELADRILVLCNGEVSGIVDARSVGKMQIGAMMVGKNL